MSNFVTVSFSHGEADLIADLLADLIAARAKALSRLKCDVVEREEIQRDLNLAMAALARIAAS